MLEANSDWHMDRAIAHFKRSHPTRIKMLRVIMVDKDMNEVRMLQSNFPEARVLICHFHVIKYLKEMRGSEKYGGKNLSAEDAGAVDAAAHAMVYAVDAAAYQKHHSELDELCDRLDLKLFMAYFDRNWDTCQDMWVKYLRAKLPHMKNNTNNALESFFGKLKECIDSNSSMAKCFKALVSNDRQAAKEYSHRKLKIGHPINAFHDEELANLLMVTTHYVADQIAPQYSIGLAKADEYVYECGMEDSDVVVVRGQRNSCRLRTTDWACDCEFAETMQLPCRHAIAYRRHKQLPGAVIPLRRIDERWTNVAIDLNHVRQFDYQVVHPVDPVRLIQKLCRSERYVEAIRATHLIANELADIDDEVEFAEMLQFVLNQWRNVRQRKRTSPTDDQVLQMSQTNSLWSSELGLIATESEQESHAMSAASSVLHAEEIAAVKIESMSKLRMTNDEDEEHSDYGGPDDEVDDVEEDGDDRERSPFKIQMNPKAKKTGRPPKKRTKTTTGEKTERVWFAANQQAREQAGEVTLGALVDSLDRDKPGLDESRRRPAGILVKHEDAANKKPRTKKLKNPVIIRDAFYVLPLKLLEKCVEKLHYRNTSSNPVVLDGAGMTSETTRPETRAKVELVQINGVGAYTRETIEEMMRLTNVKAQVELGFMLVKWCLEVALPALPAQHHAAVRGAAARVQSAHPSDSIPDLPSYPRCTIAMLYRTTPPTWLNGAFIRAVCDRLNQDFPAVRYGGEQQIKPKSRRNLEPVMDVEFIDRVKVTVEETGVDAVLIPVNFAGAHWCCIVVKVEDKCIYFYDPLNQAAFKTVCYYLACSLKSNGLNTYDVFAQNHPIQFDLFSCGVFVCWMFIRSTVKGVTHDMTQQALTRRRFELLYYVLEGRLLKSAMREDAASMAPTPTVGKPAHSPPITTHPGTQQQEWSSAGMSAATTDSGASLPSSQEPPTQITLPSSP
ncbi:hypothetical protein BBJ28_00025456 [Nothophytophthora sp. Chile5]|nr:hypothetical protein BBJ28_00025456 [Nothophytophthora sp. Chile5]